MKIKLDPANPHTWPKGRINAARLDATTESELAAQQASDDANILQGASNLDTKRMQVNAPGKGASADTL